MYGEQEQKERVASEKLEADEAADVLVAVKTLLQVSRRTAKHTGAIVAPSSH
jgi:hypothetical protein